MAAPINGCVMLVSAGFSAAVSRQVGRRAAAALWPRASLPLTLPHHKALPRWLGSSGCWQLAVPSLLLLQTHLYTAAQPGLLFCFVFLVTAKHSITIKIQCVNGEASQSPAEALLPWQQQRKEAAIGGAAEVCLGPRELVTSERPPSNYQQAALRPAKVAENNKRQQCLGGWPGTVAGHWIQQAAPREEDKCPPVCRSVKQRQQSRFTADVSHRLEQNKIFPA